MDSAHLIIWCAQLWIIWRAIGAKSACSPYSRLPTLSLLKLLRFNYKLNLAMPSHATRSVRIKQVPATVTKEQFDATVAPLGTVPAPRRKILGLFPIPRFGRSVALPVGNGEVVTSLASQFGEQFGTLTLPSERHKRKAKKHQTTGWLFDDVFNGITILHSPPAPDLE